MTESNCLITVRLQRSWSCPAKMHLRRWPWGEQDGGGVGGLGVHLSPWIHQECTFRHRNACRTPVESGQEYLTSRKEYIEPCKTRQDEGTRGGNRSVSRTGPALGGLGIWSRGPIPTSGQLSESEERHLKLRVKQLISGNLNEMRIRQSLLQPYIPQTGKRVPRTGQWLGAGVKGLWSNPRRALLLTVKRRIEGMWGRRLWWEMEESQAAMEARRYCWVMYRGWNHHHSLSPPTCLHRQLNNREAGPSNAWYAELQSRTPPRVSL